MEKYVVVSFSCHFYFVLFNFVYIYCITCFIYHRHTYCVHIISR